MVENAIGYYDTKTRYLMMAEVFWSDILNHFCGMRDLSCRAKSLDNGQIELVFSFPKSETNNPIFEKFLEDFWSLPENVVRYSDTEAECIGFYNIEDLHYFTLDFWRWRGNKVDETLEQKTTPQKYDPSMGLPHGIIKYFGEYAYSSRESLTPLINNAFYMASFDHPQLKFSYSVNDLAGAINAYTVQNAAEKTPYDHRMTTWFN